MALNKHNVQTKWMSHHLIHHNVNEWFWSFNGGRTQSWLRLAMLGIGTVHTVAESKNHAHQKTFIHMNHYFTKFNDKFRSIAQANCTQNLALLNEKILKLIGQKQI